MKAFAGDRFEAHSAGTEATCVRLEAITVMAEIGMDLLEAESKTLGRYLNQEFEYVITVCDDANESCPVFPDANRLHWSLPDPSRVSGAEEERLEVYRRARNDIQERIVEEILPMVGAGSSTLL